MSSVKRSGSRKTLAGVAQGARSDDARPCRRSRSVDVVDLREFPTACFKEPRDLRPVSICRKASEVGGVRRPRSGRGATPLFLRTRNDS